MSYAENIIMKNIDLSCKTFFGVSKAVEQYKLSNFILENLNIITKKNGYKEDVIENLITNNVSITEIPYEVD
jgi:hypothetical protein